VAGKPEWREVFLEWGIRIAFLEPDTPLVAILEGEGWQRKHSDSLAVVTRGAGVVAPWAGEAGRPKAPTGGDLMRPILAVLFLSLVAGLTIPVLLEAQAGMISLARWNGARYWLVEGISPMIEGSAFRRKP
jgi:hypothetical protein